MEGKESGKREEGREVRRWKGKNGMREREMGKEM